MHGPKDWPHDVTSEEYRQNHRFSKRLIIYNRDGEILKELSVADLLQPPEWETVIRAFNRIHWINEYDGLNFKKTPRSQYAFYRVSPDYTVLELLAKQPREKKREPPRAIRISLTDGRIIPPEEELPQEKVPVRPYQGDDHLPKTGAAWKESYTPSMDPVRSAGTYRIDTAAEAFPEEDAPRKIEPLSHGEARLIADGYTKADTPSWLPGGLDDSKTGCLLLTDLEQGKLFQWKPNLDAPSEVRNATTRGRVGPDRRFYGLMEGKLCVWQPLRDPEVILDEGIGGQEVSLNDLAISSTGRIYFTTLKDPAKGRVSVVDPDTKKVRVLFDGEEHPVLANPNGIALSREERFLFVGVSNYGNRSHSGIYAFPILADGSIDVAAGQSKKWIEVKAPDGLITDRAGNLYFTAGNKVHAYDRYGRERGTIKIPKGSGTNVAFGDDDGKTLYITTWNALYAVELK